MSVELDPFGQGSVARVQFTNTGAREFPVEARAFRGEISEDGELELVPADDDFIIFPPQLVVQAGGDQVFRIQYIGEPELTTAQVYYLSIKQMPVELQPGQPQIQILVNYNVFVSVNPPDASATPRIDTITQEVQQDVEGVVVRLVNDGAGMLLASSYKWKLEGVNTDGTAYSRTYEREELGGLVGVGVVAPGKARKFFLPIDSTVDRSTVSIVLE